MVQLRNRFPARNRNSLWRRTRRHPKPQVPVPVWLVTMVLTTEQVDRLSSVELDFMAGAPFGCFVIMHVPMMDAKTNAYIHGQDRLAGNALRLQPRFCLGRDYEEFAFKFDFSGGRVHAGNNRGRNTAFPDAFIIEPGQRRTYIQAALTILKTHLPDLPLQFGIDPKHSTGTFRMNTDTVNWICSLDDALTYFGVTDAQEASTTLASNVYDSLMLNTRRS